MTAAAPVPPRYADASLAAVLPSLLAVLSAPAASDPLGLRARYGQARAAVLLLVDGLGARQLAGPHATAAPTLTRLLGDGRVLDAGFPSTTGASLGSLGTGLPPGRHGIVGFQLATSGQDEVMNVLTWRGASSAKDLRREVVPEQWCPERTVFERAGAAGVPASLLVPRAFHESGLTRAVLRGAHPVGVLSAADLTVQVATTARDRGGLIYAYYADLDLVGHVRGPGTPSWLAELRAVDRLVADLDAALPPGTLLAVTGDHGMVPAGPVLADLDDPAAAPLIQGVRLVGGEPRMRHLYARPGAAEDVRATWHEQLGATCWVASREEVCDGGWLGPQVPDWVRVRVGDVVVAVAGAGVVVRRRAEPLASSLLGHHGSFTPEEVQVPLLVRPAA